MALALATRPALLLLDEPMAGMGPDESARMIALLERVKRDRTIVLDTTRMRVTGKGSADFHDEKMNLRLKPVAKVPQFLSLATPIEVKGTFGDFSIGVSAGDVLGTIGRFASSIFWAPIQKLVAKEIPADGRDVCSQGLSGTAR